MNKNIVKKAISIFCVILLLSSLLMGCTVQKLEEYTEMLEEYTEMLEEYTEMLAEYREMLQYTLEDSAKIVESYPAFLDRESGTFMVVAPKKYSKEATEIAWNHLYATYCLALIKENQLETFAQKIEVDLSDENMVDEHLHDIWAAYQEGAGYFDQQTILNMTDIILQKADEQSGELARIHTLCFSYAIYQYFNLQEKANEVKTAISAMPKVEGESDSPSTIFGKEKEDYTLEVLLFEQYDKFEEMVVNVFEDDVISINTIEMRVNFYYAPLDKEKKLKVYSSLLRGLENLYERKLQNGVPETHGEMITIRDEIRTVKRAIERNS